jgi:phage shock protein PspC (stress-responsive transcriptional regulator)
MTENAEMPALPAPPGAGTEPRKLRRSKRSRMVTGVCGGLAEYFGLPPAIYRILFVALALAGGTGILLYAAAALVMPEEGSDESVAAHALRNHRERPWLVIGLGLLALAIVAILSDGPLLWPLSGGAWLLALIAGAIIAWDVANRDRRASRRAAAQGAVGGGEAPPPARSWFWPGAGALLVLVGAVALLEGLDVWDLSWRIALPVGFILAGGFFAAASRWRGMAALGFLTMGLTVATGTGLVLNDLPWGGGVGDRLERPVTASQVDDRYRLSVGSLRVDLSGLALKPGETRVDASVGVGELVVELPPGVPVEVTGRVQGGDLSVLDERDDGVDVREHAVDPGFEGARKRLVLDAEVGLGHLEVRRAPR